MGIRSIPLFVSGKPTPFMQAQWKRRATGEPLQARTAYLEDDGSPKSLFRSLWAKEMPTRPHLPFEPVVDEQGRGTDRFWDVFD